MVLKIKQNEIHSTILAIFLFIKTDAHQTIVFSRARKNEGETSID